MDIGQTVGLHVMWPCNLSFLILDIGFEIPDEFVVGYALDYNEFFRDLNVSWLCTTRIMWLSCDLYWFHSTYVSLMRKELRSMREHEVYTASFNML